jgi:uncharacterized protein YutE (UPF0331/DUF86 family)
LVNPDVVQKRLRLLEGYLRKLHRIRDTANRDTFLKDTDLQDIVERNLHLAIEAVLDIGAHIIRHYSDLESDAAEPQYIVVAAFGFTLNVVVCVNPYNVYC